MAVEKNEVIESFTQLIPMFEPMIDDVIYKHIFSRIVKNEDGKFLWEISWHYRKAQSTDVGESYAPLVEPSDTIEEARALLVNYIKEYEFEDAYQNNPEYKMT